MPRLKCHVDFYELVFLIVCGMILGAACAGVGIALGSDRYSHALAFAAIGACPFAVLVARCNAIIDRAIDDPLGD